MTELRWDPVMREWVATATHRMSRPHLPTDYCPFCTDSGRVPTDYDVYIYPNDFPTFMQDPPKPDVVGDDLYRVERSFGRCDVVLYHPNHDKSLRELSEKHITKLVELWQKRFVELGSDPRVKYVFIFENHGEEIGVTMPHPHGQIFAYPKVPPRIARELAGSRAYWKRTKKCLHCEMVERERRFKKRMIFSHRGFAAFIPFYARYPYEIHLYPHGHIESIAEFDGEAKSDLAAAIKLVLRTYYAFYGFEYPYIMVMHQAPTTGRAYPYYHFHVEFYPPYRTRTKLKYRAGSETGAGWFVNDSSPEERARELKQYVPKPIGRGKRAKKTEPKRKPTP